MAWTSLPLIRAGFVTVTLVLCGCSNEFPPTSVPSLPGRTAEPALYEPPVESDYAIQIGDSLLVNSYFDPNLKQPLTVQPDGRVSLLLVGTVMAAGRTPKELGQLLSRAYRRHLDNRDITVTVTEITGQVVYVGGEVKAPMVMPIRGNITLLQAITAAGGLLGTANREQVLILRASGNGQFQTFQKNLDDSLRNEDGEPYLRRRDIVYVPKSGIARANQFVDQHINQIVPRFVSAAFGYQFFNQVGRTNVTTTPIP